MSANLRVGSAVTTTLMAMILIGTEVRADPIVWDTANAIAGGNGCVSTGPFPDTWFIAAGNDLSVIFSRMGVDLTSATAANTATTGCLVRIPVVLESNVAISELDQTLLWGYAKDKGTTGSVTARSTFCGRPTIPTSGVVGSGIEGVEALIETTSQSFFAWPPTTPFCLGRPVNCLFYANLAVAARRTDASQDESIRIYGEDIEYEALFHWRLCP
ncbi:MAG: hypothetical protein QM784_01290 [Polyangiaceae bacterium]